jgi:hypothetical protein
MSSLNLSTPNPTFLARTTSPQTTHPRHHQDPQSGGSGGGLLPRRVVRHLATSRVLARTCDGCPADGRQTPRTEGRHPQADCILTFDLRSIALSSFATIEAAGRESQHRNLVIVSPRTGEVRRSGKRAKCLVGAGFYSRHLVFISLPSHLFARWAPDGSKRI